MAESNSTLARYTRRSSSPELWVPYVMIGVSCVTFLAVHFWCYHKRNRERYLRKRDEKRVKSGLLERRRITTLMLARYQSDLGISHSGTDIDQSEDGLFYDNAADVTFDESDSNNSTRQGEHGKTARNHNVTDLTQLVVAEEATATGTKTTTGPATTASTATASTTTTTTTTASTALPSSQTWPLASERKVSCYNAHPGKRKPQAQTTDIEDVQRGINENDTEGQTSLTGPNCFTGLERGDNSNQAISLSHMADIDQTRHKTNVGLTKGRQAFSQSDPYSRPVSQREFYSRQLSHPLHTYVQGATPSPPSYHDVIYTQLTSSYPQIRSPSPVFAHFTLRHKKRRHDGAPVHSSSSSPRHRDLSWGKGGRDMPSLFDDHSGYRDPYTITGRTSQDGAFILGDSQDYGMMDQHQTSHSPPFQMSQDEVFPFAEMGHEYGTMNSKTANQNIQVIPLREIGHTAARPHFSHSNPNCRPSPSGTDRAPRGPVYVLHSESLHDLEAGASTDIGQLRPNTLSHTLPSYRPDHCFVPTKDVVIPMPERSHFNFISKSPGKVRTEALDNLSSAWPQKTIDPASLTRMESVDNSNYSPTRESQPKSPQYTNPQSQQVSSPQVSQSGSSHTQQSSPLDNMPGHNIQSADKADHGSRQDSYSIAQDGQSIPATQPGLQTPSLRDLNPRLVFQHCKRKLALTNSE